jgi:hypothetical protein
MRLAIAMVAIFALVGCSEVGRYQIVPSTDGRVWRADTKTGQLARCYSDGTDVLCVMGNPQ